MKVFLNMENQKVIVKFSFENCSKKDVCMNLESMDLQMKEFL